MKFVSFSVVIWAYPTILWSSIIHLHTFDAASTTKVDSSTFMVVIKQLVILYSFWAKWPQKVKRSRRKSSHHVVHRDSYSNELKACWWYCVTCISVIWKEIAAYDTYASTYVVAMFSMKSGTLPRNQVQERQCMPYLWPGQRTTC